MSNRKLCVLLCVLCLAFSGLATLVSPSSPAIHTINGLTIKEAAPNHDTQPPSDAAAEPLFPDMTQLWEPSFAQRTYLRYNVQSIIWTEEETNFPASWVKAARQAVLTGTDRAVCSFSRGFLYDFDWDGHLEAIFLMAGPKEKRSFIDGDSYFVYVSADGASQLLASGCDIDIPADMRKMDASILHYPAFDQLIIRTGNETAAGGVFHLIYGIQNGVATEVFAQPWLWSSSHVFLESAGPQGMGTTFWFWDTDQDRYSIVGPVSMPVEAFLAAFDGAKFCDPKNLKYEPEAFQKELQKSGIRLSALTPDMISSVDVYGGLYYHIQFSETGCPDSRYRIMTLKRGESGSFSGAYGPASGLSSLSYGVNDPDKMVFDADLRVDERQTQAVPDGLRLELQGLLSGNPIDYQRVSDRERTYELIVTDTYTQGADIEGVFAQADIFIRQRQEGGIPRLIQQIPVSGRVSPLSKSGLAYAPDGGLFLSDVDFDGQPDLLVHLGMFGIQGYSTYACYLQRDGGFVDEESFSSIMNPYVDPKSKGVCAFWRNWAASHSWARYEYQNGAFIETARITSEPTPESDPGSDEIEIIYTCETLQNGELQVRETLLSADYGKDEIFEKLDAYGCAFGRVSQSYAAEPDFSPLLY